MYVLYSHSLNIFDCNLSGELINYVDAEHARALEEQWIDSIDNAGSATLSQSSSSSSSFLQGVLVGFFFPFLPFFFMSSRKPAAFWEDGSEQEPSVNVIFS